MSTDTLDSMPIEMVEFTARDRCDRCVARAYALSRKDKLELYWCNHHKNKHYNSLLDNGWEVIEDYEAVKSLS